MHEFVIINTLNPAYIALMLTLFRFTSPLLKGLSTRYSYSAKKLSNIAQSAAWSSAFIKEISDPVLPSKPEDPSLLDRLKALQIESKEFNFGQSFRQRQMEIFTEGVELQSKAFNLNTIVYDKNYSMNRPIFQPNLLYTSSIFKTLLKTGSIALLCGHEGIGKTFSILLFTVLSTSIHRFIFEAQKDSNLSSQLAQLKSHNLIVDVPKYWYYSLKKRNQKRTEKYFHKLLLQQAPQLSNDERGRLYNTSSYDELLQEINRVYNSAGIQQQFFIDDLDNAILQLKESKEGGRFNEYSAYINAFEFIDKFKKIGLGGYYPYTYDMQGQLDLKLSGKIDSNLNMLNLGRENKPLQKLSVPHGKKLIQFWQVIGMIDMVDLYVKTKKENRKKYIEYLENMAINEILTPKELKSFAIYYYNQGLYINKFFLQCFNKTRQKICLLLKMGSKQECEQKIQFLKELIIYADTLPSVKYFTVSLPKLRQMAKSPFYQQLIKEEGIYHLTFGLKIDQSAQTATFVWEFWVVYQLICSILANKRREQGSYFRKKSQLYLRTAIFDALQQQGQITFWTKGIQSKMIPLQVKNQLYTFKIQSTYDYSQISDRLISQKLNDLFETAKQNPHKIYFAKFKQSYKEMTQIIILFFVPQANCYQLFTFCTNFFLFIDYREKQANNIFKQKFGSYNPKTQERQVNYTHVIFHQEYQSKAGYELSQSVRVIFSPFEKLTVKNDKLPQKVFDFKNIKSNIIMEMNYEVR